MRVAKGRTRAILFAAAFWFAALLADLFGVTRGLDARLGDMLLQRHAQERTPPADIVLVDIDQKSLDDPAMLELAGNWPWPRAIHGELITWLATREPAAIAIDLIFSEPDVFRPQSDALFSDALRKHPAYLPLVVASDGAGSRLAALPPQMGIRRLANADFSETSAHAALPLIAPKALDPAVWRTGLINFLADADGIGRRYWTDYPHQGWGLPSLPMRIARDMGVTEPGTDSIRLHWYGQPFTRVSYAELYLASQQQHPKNILDLNNKILIVGATAPGLHDLRPTPLGASTQGPEILATALANLRQQDWLRPVSKAWSHLLGAVLLIGVAVAYASRRNPMLTAGGLALATLLSAAGATQLLSHNLYWTPFGALIFAWLFFVAKTVESYLRERRQRDHAIQAFGRFIDPRVVKTITDGERMAEAQVGRSREITLLFSDIRGFTTLSETRPPEEIVALLNRYFDLQVEAVFAHQGTLDKFIGDAIMAFWGAPIDDPQHARHAVEAALDMSDRLDRFKLELGDIGAGFDVGIGIHSGPAVVGFLGSSRRLDYTAIGDTVNLASRIEGQTKGIARILVSESTRALCSDDFDFIDHGEYAVKGRAQPVRLFEPRRKTT